MKRIKVGHNQSIWDIAIQHCGSYDSVKELIIDNPTKCNFETSIPVGTELFIRDEPVNKNMVDYLSANKLIPCTAVEHPFNNSLWILAGGVWNNNGFWDNNANWII